MAIYHYTYLITNIQEEKHYIGVRSCNRLPEEDLGKKYFSSSKDKIFKKDLMDNPLNYQYQILEVFDNRKEALGMEISLHNYFNVGSNNRFYNKAKQTSTGFDTAGVSFFQPKTLADTTIYKFIHCKHGVVECTGWQMAEKLNIEYKRLSPLLIGKSETCMGWYIYNTDHIPTYAKIFKFSHSQYGIRECSTEELRKEFSELKQYGLSTIIRGVHKQYKGWVVLDLKLSDLNKTMSDEDKRKRADQTIYHFVHLEHGERICTRFDLSKEFPAMNRNDLSFLVNKQSICSKGWYLKGNEPKKYEFCHDEFGEYYCTEKELLEKFSNLVQGGLYSIINGPYKKHLGWYIKGTDITYKRTINETIFTFSHPTHGIRICRGYDLLQEFSELTNEGLWSIKNNKNTHHKGWTIIK